MYYTHPSPHFEALDPRHHSPQDAQSSQSPVSRVRTVVHTTGTSLRPDAISRLAGTYTSAVRYTWGRGEITSDSIKANQLLGSRCLRNQRSSLA